MSEIPSNVEQELSKLSPAVIDEGFLNRLIASAEGSAVELSSEEMDFETSLLNIKPRKISSELDSSLLEKLSEVPFAVDEKIVLFNGKSRTVKNTGKNNIFRFNIAAAAAVALLGSIAAFMVPHHTGGTSITVSKNPTDALEEVNVPYVPPTMNNNLSTASFDTLLNDEVATWSYPMQPQRILRPTFFDENEIGENAISKQPRLQYGIIPVTEN